MQRDQQVNEQLQAMGYTIFRFWEFEVAKELAICVGKIVHHINKLKEKAI